MVDRERQQLEIVIPEPVSTCDPAFESGVEQLAFFNALADAKHEQFETIRSQLPEDIRDWNISLVSEQVCPLVEDDRYMDYVAINLPGQDRPLEARFLVSDSDKTANVNLLLPVHLKLPEGTEIICVDPEKFMRPVQLFTRQEMLTRDFIDNKSSVPMRPYLEKARAREVKPDAVPQGNTPSLDF